MRRIFVLSTLVFMMILLFVVPYVIVANSASECPIPTSVTCVDSKGNSGPLISIVETNVEANCPNGSGTCYKWVYNYAGPTPNQASVLAPDCCSSMGYPTPAGGQVRLPGQGDSTTGFGSWSGYEYVIRMAYNPAGSLYTMWTDRSASSRSTAIQIKVNNVLYYCKNIQGPACPGPSYVPSLKALYMIVDGMWVKLDIDSNDCIQQAYACRSNWETCDPLPPVTAKVTTIDADLTETTSTMAEISDMMESEMLWGRGVMADSPGCTLLPLVNILTRIMSR